MRSLLASVLLVAAVFSLPAQQALADGQNSQVSPEHARLIRLLKENQAQADRDSRENDQAVAPAAGTAEDSLQPRKVAPETAPDRVYSDPAGEEKSALLQGLARRISTMTPSGDGSDLQLLSEYNRLLGLDQTDLKTAVQNEGILPGEPNTEEIEPNDSWAAAQKIEYGNVVAGSAIPSQDTDIYSFSGRKGDFVRIEALPTSGSGFHVVMLFDADSNLVSGGHYRIMEPDPSSSLDLADPRFAPIIWPGNNVVGASLEKDGTYYVVVTTYPGGIIFLKANDQQPQADTDDGSVTYSLSFSRLEVRQVTGSVTDDAGHPVADAQISFWSYAGIGGTNAVSGADGSFTIDLPEGQYSFSVINPAGSRYPNDQIYDTFEVTAEGAKLALVLKSGVIFSGTAVDDRGNPVPYVGFSLVDNQSYQYRWGSSDEKGNFSIAVFPGTFDIYLYVPYDYPAQPMIRGVEITQDTHKDIIIDSGKQVSGMVYSADGLPQAQVSLVFRSVSDSRWAQSGEDGSYRVAVLAGTYWVEVWADNSRLIPHQVLGPLEVIQDTAWDLKLSAGGLLSGSVVDDRGNRVTGALVNVWRISDDVTLDGGDSVKTADGVVRLADDGADSLLIMPFVPGSSAVAPPFYVSNYYNFYTDETGAWKAALMPGQYAVEVVPPYEYPQKSYKVDVYEVTEGARFELGEVKIEYGVLFSGRVVLADGKPLAWQTVSLLSPVDSGEKPDNGIAYPVWIEPYYRADFYTDENGTFSRRVFPGIYDLLFYGGTGDPSYPRQTIKNFDLSRDLSLTITLEAGNRLYGTVADEQGKGLEGSYLSFFLDDGTWVGGVPNGPDGAYQIQLMPGVYNLVVSPTMGYFPDSAGLSLKLDGDRKLDVTLRPGVKVYGRVTDASGQPLAQVSVQLVASFQKADTVFKNLVLESFRAANSLLPEGADQPDSTVADSVKPVYTDQAGRYALQPWFDNRAFYAWTDDAGNWEVLVKKGVYDIYAAYYYNGYAGAFLPAVDCNKERRVDLVLEDAQITVEGVVKDESGQPVPMTLVSLLDPKTGGNVYGWTDQAGRFALNVPQGQYEIFVDGGDDSAPSRSVASNLTVDRNQNLDIQLGTGILNGDSKPGGPKLPRAFALAQNYPNPFNPSTTISYTIADPAQVALTIFDLRGRKVATLVDRQQEEGDYTVQWDGKDSEGRALSSGIYFYRLKSGAQVATRKMVLLK